ncbi:uncharacterized protein F4822DRAFT_424632 [Hypoxylon trugodes]|uniref:uncharacterized protein n=1 Tax=Hypoxylon trugodes TaxID=326681 RepID=UPI00219E156B|nr:uncharacterized protein F4822DRAFT_424632 [Hypoxylon trugodes]KAI1394165.1 hypothetical protein F4822DRAFT_424632 [Hypoxylon trugodes]
MTLRAFTEIASADEKPQNMCGWMFELLRSDPIALGADFRVLFRRFGEAFGSTGARCARSGSDACDGRDWHDCLRFDRVEGVDQTMHDFHSPHDPTIEAKVKWDEESYLKVSGARAVSVSESQGDILRYCVASNKTIAFSHVWSHGQGSRPHLGINRCLHDRYIGLACKLGCDSYWIDAACIPEDDTLRSEAILHINDVFYRSQQVIVCDRDLMTLDACPLTVRRAEVLLAGVILSDWNLRAWTMLEALKGRNHVSILCRDDQVVMFQDVLERVCRDGRIDLAAFSLFLPHMVRNYDFDDERSRRIRDYGFNVDLEQIGSWLSHRPASRERDYATIWNLCLAQQKEGVKTIEDFWKQERGINILTGFLLSPAPRLSAPGLSWAPKTPFALPDRATSPGEFHMPITGEATQLASVCINGLWGPWWIHVMDLDFLSTTKGRMSKTGRELRRVRKTFKSLRKHVALLRPVLNQVYNSWDPEEIPSSAKSGVLLAVCDSDKTEKGRQPGADPVVYMHDVESYKWIWRGVYQWPAGVELPKFVQFHSLWLG